MTPIDVASYFVDTCNSVARATIPYIPTAWNCVTTIAVIVLGCKVAYDISSGNKATGDLRCISNGITKLVSYAAGIGTACLVYPLLHPMTAIGTSLLTFGLHIGILATALAVIKAACDFFERA